MLKTRKRWISLLVTLAMLVAFVVPAGTAFADDPVTFTGAALEGVAENNAGTGHLGWAKVTLKDATDINELYVTAELPDGVEWATAPSDISDVSITGAAGAFVSADEQSITVRVYDSDGSPVDMNDSVTFTFDGLKIKDTAPEKIYVTITAKAVDNSTPPLQVWEYSKEVLVGIKGTGTLSIEAGSIPTLGTGTNKAIADITLKENVAGAAVGSAVYLELPSGFSWYDGNGDGDADKIGVSSKYNLNATNFDIIDSKTLCISGFSTSAPFAGELKIKGLKITVQPIAPEGELELDVWCTDSDLMEDTSIVVANIGDAKINLSTEDYDGADTAYVGAVDVDLNTIKFESDATFGNADAVITLPEGVEYDSVTASTNCSVIDTFDNNSKVWIDFVDTADNATLTLRVNVTAAANPGKLEVAVSGDAEGTLELGEIKARVNATAEKTGVSVGLNQPVGVLTISETEKNSIANATGQLVLELSNGAEFSKKPTVKINGTKIDGAINWGSDHSIINFNLEDFRSGKIDTIEVSDIELDLASQIAIGKDIVVSVYGSAVNAENNNEAVAKVAIATVKSPTASTATLKIGDPTITINGVAKTMEAAPYIKDGRTFIPVRYAANAVGVADDNILWDAATGKVTIIKGDRVAQFTIGSNGMTINGAAITMDAAPEIVAGRTMLPVRFVAQALGANITWDAATQVVTISVD